MLDEVVHQLVPPAVVSWNAAISACENREQCDEALGLLQQLVHQLLKANVVS